VIVKNQKKKANKTASIARIMSFYNPKILAFISLFASCVNAFGFPLYGFIFSKVLFVMMSYGHINDYDY
jgi:hypothetical protein